MQCSLGFLKFIANICEQTTNFFSLTKVLLELIFFPEVMLEIGGVAYTRVFTVLLMINVLYTIKKYIFGSFIYT